MKKRSKRLAVRDRLVEIGWWVHMAVSEVKILRNGQQWGTWLRVVLRLAPWQPRRLRSRAAQYLTWLRYQNAAQQAGAVK